MAYQETHENRYRAWAPHIFAEICAQTLTGSPSGNTVHSLFFPASQLLAGPAAYLIFDDTALFLRRIQKSGRVRISPISSSFF
jgi:hypothetical protein